MNRLEAFGYVSQERDRQDEKWGTDRSHLNSDRWLTVVTEELGECARAILEDKHVELKKELIQLTAVCLAWLEQFPNQRAQ